MSVQARVEILRFWASGVWSERYVIVFEHKWHDLPDSLGPCPGVSVEKGALSWAVQCDSE